MNYLDQDYHIGPSPLHGEVGDHFWGPWDYGGSAHWEEWCQEPIVGLGTCGSPRHSQWGGLSRGSPLTWVCFQMHVILILVLIFLSHWVTQVTPNFPDGGWLIFAKYAFFLCARWLQQRPGLTVIPCDMLPCPRLDAYSRHRRPWVGYVPLFSRGNIWFLRSLGELGMLSTPLQWFDQFWLVASSSWVSTSD